MFKAAFAVMVVTIIITHKLDTHLNMTKLCTVCGYN